MKQTLFAKNNETMEELLIRKFRIKYIDHNPAFINDPWVKENLALQKEAASSVASSTLRASRIGQLIQDKYGQQSHTRKFSGNFNKPSYT